MTWKRILTTLVMLVILAGLIWFGFFRQQESNEPAFSQGVPVLTDQAKRQDVPIILHGIGTVRAFQHVDVTPQVGGKLLDLKFKEGETVKKGQVLARIDPVLYQADLDEARAQLASDQADLVRARHDLKRYAELAKNDYASKQQADQARADVQRLQAQIKADKARIASAQAELGYTDVVAPITGRAGIRKVDVGNIMAANDDNGIVTLTQLRPIHVLFTLPGDKLSQIRRAGADKNLPVKVFGSDNEKPLDEGELDVTDNEIDTQTGTLKFRARLPNEDEQLWPGQFVNVQLEVGTRNQALVVPVAAVQQGPDGAFVYGIEDGKARMHKVEVDQEDETQAVITQGLKAGQTVITSGFGQLSDGMRIKQDEQAEDDADNKADTAPDNAAPSAAGSDDNTEQSDSADDS